MKHSILLFGFFFLTISAYGQNTLIVDNTGSAPTGDHIYTNLQAAIDAAQEGDVIQLIPSPNSYGVFDIGTEVSNLSIIGSGYLPEKSGRSLVIAGTISGDNIVLSGLVFTLNLTIDSGDPSDKATNIVIRNSSFDRDNTGGASMLTLHNASNVIFESCFINRPTNGLPSFSNNANNVVITNSIITSQFSQLFNTNIEFSIISVADGFISGGQISNNQFTNSILVTDFGDGPQNSSFVNNYSTNELPIGLNGNTGSENIIREGVTNIFEDDGTNWLNEFNPNLPDGSELIGAANDGGDLGVFGGSGPYSRTGQSLPTITDLIAPLSIKVGTNTEVTIKAKGN